MNDQMQMEKRMAESYGKLSPELQEKLLCVAEGMRLAEQMAEAATKTA